MTQSSPLPIELLSPTAQHVLRINAADAYRLLVTRDGNGAIEVQDVLESLKPAETVKGAVVNHNAAACVVAALWLWHDFLEASHTIVQAVETPTGSLWHAILHRREGDFDNAKYWYRRAGQHAGFTALAAQANDLTQSLPADKSLLKVSANGWNPSAFVDLCAAVHDQPADPRQAAAIAIQRVEWQNVMSATIREAIGG